MARGRLCLETDCTNKHYAKDKCSYHYNKKPCTNPCGNIMGRYNKTCLPCNKLLTGSEHPAWKGGKTKTRGYVKVKIHGHHRANPVGYVLEHIVVMESKLGRRLMPGENVHHINGVRDDNRPENLELWIVSQPAGQRPEDLVKWAEEIMELYGKGVLDGRWNALEAS